MRILMSPQVTFEDKRFDFVFSGESISATFDGETDAFDFSELPDGEVDFSMIETTLEYNPIIVARRVDGILSVELLNFISEDASELEKFPEWVEVQIMAKINWKVKEPYKDPEPTEVEYMMLAIAELDALREADKTANEMSIAELAEALMGGM